jgi:PAS domain S-box-containing protein
MSEGPMEKGKQGFGKMNDTEFVYSSRITKIYLEYLKKNHPDVDQGALLEEAGLTLHEITDPSRWLSQAQVERFQEVVVRKTGNHQISREAGRYSVSAEALGRLKQFAVGLMGLESIYLIIEKVYPLMSRGATAKTRKLGPNKIEVIVTPKPNIGEKPFQCENRMGSLESLARLFTKDFARIEHPSCFHRGDENCRYVISWPRSPSFFWKQIRNAGILLSLIIFPCLFPLFPLPVWMATCTAGILACMILSLWHARTEKRELLETCRSQAEASKDLIKEMEARSSYAVLVQELDRLTFKVQDMEKLIQSSAEIMKNCLPFNRCLTLLPDGIQSRLYYAAGYGFSQEQEDRLKKMGWSLRDSDSPEWVARVFRNKSALVLHNRLDPVRGFFPVGWDGPMDPDIQSLLCVPIQHQNRTLGVLVASARKAPGSGDGSAEAELQLLQDVASLLAMKMTEVEFFHKLQQSEEKYRTIIQTIEEGYYEVDLAGNMTFSNEAGRRILGYSPEEFLGINNRQIMDPETAREVYQTFHEVYRTGLPSKAFARELIRKDGSRCFVETSVSLIKGRKGEPVGFRGLARDVTDRKRVEEEWKRAKEAADRSNRAKSEFLANMSHELRTPLNHIIGFTELVVDQQAGKLNGMQAEYLGDVLASSRHLLSLINDILDLSKVEAGKVELEAGEVSLPDLLQNSFTMIKEKATKHRIRLQMEIDGIPEQIRGDERKLKQILYNLLSNAVKFTPDGGVVTLSACRLFSRDHQWTKEDGCVAPIPFAPPVAGEWAGISIRDTGIGVKGEDLKRIFAPFEQADNSMGRRYQGTGLGLSLTRQLVELHRGRIWAESEGEGKGSKFSFILPLNKEVSLPDKRL